MEHKILSVVERTEFRKGPAKKLRSQGFIPAVVYGHSDPLHISVSALEFNRKFKVVTENTIITLKLADKDIKVLVKALDEDILTETIRHIDFYEFERGKVLKTNVPIRLTGNSIGVKEGGTLEQKLNELEIECLPKDIPESINIDVGKLAMGESIHVNDISVAETVKILSSQEQTIVVVTAPKAEVEESSDEELDIEQEEGKEEESV